MPGYFRLCAVTPKQVRNCSEKALVSKDFEIIAASSANAPRTVASPDSTKKELTANAQVQKSAVDSELKGRAEIRFSDGMFSVQWMTDNLDFFALLILGSLVALYLVLKFRAGRPETPPLSNHRAMEARPADTLKDSPAALGKGLETRFASAPLRPPEILRIFRAGSEYRMEF